MQHTTFLSWNVWIDPQATVTATAAARHRLRPLDARCTLPCRALLQAIESRTLPAVVEDFLRCAGVDPRIVEDVDGEPEEGFLTGWWILVGKLDKNVPAGTPAELESGFRCWLHTDTAKRLPPLDGLDLLRLEFEWRGSGIFLPVLGS